MKSSLKKAGYVLLPLVAYYVLHDVIRIILMYILQLAADTGAEVYEFILKHELTLSAVISALTMLGGAWIIIFLMKKDPDELALGDYVNLRGISFYRQDRLHKPWFSWVNICVQSIAAALGLNSLLWLSGISKQSDSYGTVSSSMYAIPVWIGILLYVIISPAVEELLFRTVIFGRMKRCFPYAIAVIVSGLFFGLYHRNLVQGIYGTMMGILMCLACEYVHTIVGAYVFHAVANVTVYLLTYFGKLSIFGTVRWCITFLILAAISLFVELFYSYKSRKEFGVEYGIERVGCFFIDDTIEIEYIDEE